MRVYIYILIISFVFFSLNTLGCITSSNIPNSVSENDESESTLILENGEIERFKHLYHSTILQLLNFNVWNTRDIEDASHILMMPMHLAFLVNYEEAIKSYDLFFIRFINDLESSTNFSSLSRLQRMQFLYLASEYMKISIKYRHKLNKDLYRIILNYAKNDLQSVATWRTEPTVKEHLEKIIEHKTYAYSYYSTVLDADFYTLACLCDLAFVARIMNFDLEDDTKFAISYVTSLLGDSIINTETPDGYWLFQVGVQKDNNEYSYAGHEHSFDGMQPKQKDDIVTDTSHFRRMPLWLISFRDAQINEEAKSLFSNRIAQLGNLFASKVLKFKDNHYVTTTFIDGSNGVFRYDYHDDGKAIEGFDKSGGVLFLGYWIMLDNLKILEAYKDILSALPMQADVSNVYYDNNTVREQHPLMDKDKVWSNGMMDVLIECICKIGEMTGQKHEN